MKTSFAFEQLIFVFNDAFDLEFTDNTRAENPTLCVKGLGMLEAMPTSSLQQRDAEAASNSLEATPTAVAQSNLDMFKRLIEKCHRWHKY